MGNLKKLSEWTVEELLDVYADDIQEDTDIESKREVLHDVLVAEAKAFDEKYTAEDDAYFASINTDEVSKDIEEEIGSE